MIDDGRSPPSTLKGRLADVYVPAVVSGSLDALSRRLGNRATIDDPLQGRASSVASIEALLSREAAYFAERSAEYTHVSSTTGIDRDIAEGRLTMTLDGQSRGLPIVVVAERRRLREIELRIYYALDPAVGPRSRAPLITGGTSPGAPRLVEEFLAALAKGATDAALGAFEESSRIVDPDSRLHTRESGAMRTFLANFAHIDVAAGGCADDGRTICAEVTVTRKSKTGAPGLLAFQRGASGLVNELRVYM